MDLELNGKKVLVTGTSKGIGAAIARLFAKEGVAELVLVARNEKANNETRDAILAEHDLKVRTYTMDLGDGCNAMRLAAKCSDIDILINNAGDVPGGAIEAISDDEWRKGWDAKVFGYINMTRAFFTAMKKRGQGTIVNNIGNTGERLDSESVAACSGNAALMALTRSVGSVSPESGVRILGVNPGPVMTERIERLMRKKAQDRHGDAELWRDLIKPMPFGRIATPEETAILFVFLASPLCAYVSGTIVTIDGGISSRGVVF